MLAANERLNTAYLLNASFSRLWGYEREGRARKLFAYWYARLKWQRQHLNPYEKCAQVIDRHCDGIATSLKLKNKGSLGFV